MGKNSTIRWTDDTWNPWMGCRHVDPSCDHCYMYAWSKRTGTDPKQVRRSKTTFYDPLTWKEPRRIFTCSLSDFFIAEADAWRPEAWDIIRATPHHAYMILTKRPSRILRCLPPDWGEGWPHVWIGVSGGDPAWLKRRLPLLRRVPAVVRFLSIEPLLAPIETIDLTGIHWVIVGGESGPSIALCLIAGSGLYVMPVRGRRRLFLQAIEHLPRWAGRQSPTRRRDVLGASVLA